MAKKQTALPTYFAPNAALIKGAGAVAASEAQVFKPVKLDLQAIASYANNAKREKQAKIDKETNTLQSYLNAKESIDPNIIPTNYSKQVEQQLLNYKSEYFDVSKQLSQIDANDPDYMDLRDRLFQINSGIKSIAKTFNDQRDNKDIDAEMLRKGELSLTNDPFKVEAVRKILTNEADMKIENGVVLYEYLGDYIKYEDIPGLRSVANDQAKQISGELNAQRANARKLPLSEQRIGELRQEFETVFDDEDTFLSMAEDKFGGYDLQIKDDKGNVIPVVDAERRYAAEGDDFKNRVIDAYIELYQNAHNAGMADYKKLYPEDTDTSDPVATWKSQQNPQYIQMLEAASSGLNLNNQIYKFPDPIRGGVAQEYKTSYTPGDRSINLVNKYGQTISLPVKEFTQYFPFEIKPDYVPGQGPFVGPQNSPQEERPLLD